MPALTEALIRKRAEHNDGCLPDLEEVALHQQELEKIESLEGCCRHIKILLLQNNIIPKMEGLSKLKELEYLNLALNNVSMVEGIEGCESLKKLDMTVNFIDLANLEESVYNMKANVMLEDLYLTGNPCADWCGCRSYVIAHLPSVKQLDGKLVLPADRIRARQMLPQLQADYERAVMEEAAKKPEATGIPVSEGAYTKECRNEMYLELAEQKEEKDRNERRRMGTEAKPKREVPGVYNARGEVRQCNEGKYDFDLDDHSESGKIIFELHVPKYLETSELDVDVNPLYVRCVIKSKVTQLKLPTEISPDNSKVQRARITGILRIEMPLADQSRTRQPRAAPAPELQPLKPEGPYPDNRPRPSVASGSLHGIYKDPNKKVSKTKKPGQTLLKEVTSTTSAKLQATRAAAAADDDDDDVPPLLTR